jgi:hypothetical protein
MSVLPRRLVQLLLRAAVLLLGAAGNVRVGGGGDERGAVRCWQIQRCHGRNVGLHLRDVPGRALEQRRERFMHSLRCGNGIRNDRRCKLLCNTNVFV